MKSSVCAFPDHVWLKFYLSEDSSKNSSSRIRFVSNSKDVEFCIQQELERNEYHYMEAESYGCQCFYHGILDVNKVLQAIHERFKNTLIPLIKADAYVLTEDFQAKTERYLGAVLALIGKDFDMESVVDVVNSLYGESADVQKCLDAIKSIRKA